MVPPPLGVRSGGGSERGGSHCRLSPLSPPRPCQVQLPPLPQPRGLPRRMQ
uniref:Uncharacterized protein n=1 Tax=Arundo donax TaxID=35708 RepID=A0A0A9EBI2_ARUDO